MIGDGITDYNQPATQAITVTTATTTPTRVSTETENEEEEEIMSDSNRDV